MLSIALRRCSVLIVIVVMTMAGALLGQDVGQPTTLGAADQDYEPKAASEQPNGALQLIMVARPLGHRSGPGNWLVGSAGRSGRPAVQPLAMNQPADEQQPSAVALVAGPRSTLVTAYTDCRIVLRMVGSGGKAGTATTVTPTTPGCSILRLTPAGAGRLVGLGTAGARGYVFELTADGKAVSETTIDVEGLTVTDAVIIGERRFAVGTVATSPQDVRVWVGEIGPKGRPLTQVLLNGRTARAARLGKDRLALVINRGTGRETDTVVTAFAPDLKEQWTRPLTKPQQRVPPIDIVEYQSGVLAATAQDGALTWTAFDGSGERTSTRTLSRGEEHERTVSLELLNGTHGVAVVSAAAIVEKRTQRQVVRVRWLEPS